MRATACVHLAAHEWCRAAVCILLCCSSLLCVSEALCAGVDVYLGACGQLTCTDTHSYTSTHTLTHAPTKLITAPVSLAVIISLNRNKYILPGSDALSSKVCFHTFTEQPLSLEREKDTQHAQAKLKIYYAPYNLICVILPIQNAYFASHHFPLSITF